MLGTSLFGSDSPAAVRKPTPTITFGGSGGAAGGLGGVAAAVGSALGVNLGGGADPWQQHVIALRVESGLAPFVDVAEITAAITPQLPRVALGDAGALALGYSDEEVKTVLTGKVTAIRQGTGVQQIRLSNGGGDLAQRRLNQSFEQQTAGDMVKELAGLVEAPTETVEAGADYPFYVLSHSQSAYRHLAELARQNNFAAWFTPAGKLVFAPLAEGDPVATFTYGTDLLAVQISEAPSVLAGVTVVGEGAAGSQGANAWPWLVKDPAAVTGRAGDGTAPRLVSAAGLRTGDLVQTTAAGLVNFGNMGNISGRLLVPGAPAVTVGSTIELVNAPQPIANGRFLVQRVRHDFTRQQGFTTLINFVKVSEGGGGLAGALGGLF
jgi:phage protein D